MSSTMTPYQAAILNAKIGALGRLKAAFTKFPITPTPESRPFMFLTPGPFPNYPAAGAGNAISILTIQVPFGAVMVINKLAIVHFGGGQVDGQGTVIWRAAINGANLNGLENMQAQTGTFAQPNDAMVFLMENDVFTITVETTAAVPGQTAARAHGYITPIARGEGK